ncbi:Uncharacterised protein [Clostridioides difficile]|uniref:hypothetical protein n=1 Tax=Clostridioides difficile TaxID=1496 RepID=UPI001024D7C2|nr:hypothetical protein [Clostridioides difficile]VFF93566.1 Uncharacterised protein [Clostridioides difficile]VIG04857.1 Uncharacterised protein [Clostridioides difficile]HBF4772053.1 hypothetical protein [Clostridioides difficile]HBF5037982.1 hypothetical protein [Clostridioides difficile]HBF5410707.1 hypothetical protein [Clostridioides difficile]
MKAHELELKVRVSIPILTVIFYMAIVSIVLLGLSALNSFNNIKSIPIDALGLTIGFIVFNLIRSLFKCK